MSLATEVTEYLRGERAPFRFTTDDLARLIFLEATHNAMWTKATMPQWEAAINEAIKIGLIESRSGKLGVASKQEEAKPMQMGLFE